MCLCLLKISMLEELLDSLQWIDFGIYLIIEGGWFEEACHYLFYKVCRYLYISLVLHPQNLLFLDLRVW